MGVGAPAAMAKLGPHEPVVTIAIVPNGTSPEELASVGPFAVGVASAGLGRVSSQQTYLDITQGSRVWSSLYPGGIPLLDISHGLVEHWPYLSRRGRRAPASIVPGLLASTLVEPPGSKQAVKVKLGTTIGSERLIAADRAGRLPIPKPRCPFPPCQGSLVVRTAGLDEVGRLARRLSGLHLVIALERPPPQPRRQLTIGIAGSGFAGTLTSRSTRTEGYVLVTDIAPTVLRRFFIPVPDEMEGRRITSRRDGDAAAVTALEHRMAVVGPRRQPVIRDSLFIWLLLAIAAIAVARRRGARIALPLVVLAAAYMPAVLLVTAAIGPSLPVERLSVAVGAPLLAAATIALAGLLGGLAVACAVTVTAHAADMVAGSPLTSLSLMGPNPALGARFYGIGNELEAALMALVLIGSGAGLAVAMRRNPGRWRPRRAAMGFVAASLLAAAVFAAGPFGADVGAAVALPFGGVVAGGAGPGPGRRRGWIALAVAAPVLAAAGIAAADMALGGDAHLSRSVLEAGGLDRVAEVAERRLTLSAGTFQRGSNLLFIGILAAVAALAVWRRRKVASWLRPVPAAAAGLAGALAATLLGTVANDSGALLLVIGGGYVVGGAAVAWAAVAREADREPGG